MMPFLDRMIIEKSDLDAKIANLRSFLADPELCADVTFNQHFMMAVQKVTMDQYSQILGDRIADLKSEEPTP